MDWLGDELYAGPTGSGRRVRNRDKKCEKLRPHSVVSGYTHIFPEDTGHPYGQFFEARSKNCQASSKAGTKPVVHPVVKLVVQLVVNLVPGVSSRLSSIFATF